MKQLSSSATIGALRAFYLSVHPDFFAQHPQIQKVNETSLKRLNSYLEAIQCAGQIKSLEPAKVTFYFRKKAPNTEDFRRVNFTLRSHDLLTNIEHILISCGLPSTHLDEVTQKDYQRTSELPLEQRYRKSNDGTGGLGSFSSDKSKAEDMAATISFRRWLRKNTEIITKRQIESKAIIEINELFKSDICLNYGLGEIAWCSPWQCSSEQGILRNFARFCNQHKEEVQCLQGKRLVFTDHTMAAADGSICLNVEDVPQQWLQFLSKFDETYSKLYEEAERLDRAVHNGCGNIQVIRPRVHMSRFREHNLVSVREYLSILGKFWSSLQSFSPNEELTILPESLKDHEITFAKFQNSEDNKIIILPNGRLRIDGDCDPRYMISFLIQNKVAIEEKKYLNASAKSRSQQLVELCQEKFVMQSVTKDFDVEHEQMANCCERLLQNTAEFSLLLNSLELRITSNYYSVFDHGQFCIPWDWKT